MTLGFLIFVQDAFAAGSMSLVPDPILMGLQMIPFLITLVALNAILYKPMLAYLEDRDTATVGARNDAERLEQEAEAKLGEYDEHLTDARAQIAAERHTLRAQAHQKREAALAQARTEAEASLAAALTEIGGARDEASNQLKTLSSALATDIASSVLGREVTA